jgi:predicted enzyme related to lactoylglutathione lyase
MGKNNVVGWFEILVLNMERAIRFYERIFEFKLTRQQVGPLDMAWFPWVDAGLGAYWFAGVQQGFLRPHDFWHMLRSGRVYGR